MASSTASPLDITPADPPPDKPPRRRRWIPVSVRLLFLLLLVFGVVEFSLIAVRGYTNAAFIKEIEQLGGEVRMRPCTPEWLQRQAHGDWTTLLDDIVMIRPGYDTATDEWLAGLRRFAYLEDLWLSGSSVTDAGIEHLKRLKNLRSLGLTHSSVTAAGLVHLSEMTNLTYLSLEGTKVGDAGLMHLSRLQNLECLNLEFTQVTGAGLAPLRELTNLKRLRLSIISPEDEEGLADLKRALPVIDIEDGLYITRGSYYLFRQSHSPLFFASGALLAISVVVVWSLGLIYLLPLAVAKVSAWFAGRCPGAGQTAFRSHVQGFPCRLSRSVRLAQATAALITVVAALFVATPIVRRQIAVHALERSGGHFLNRARSAERGQHPVVGRLQQLDSLTDYELRFIDDTIADSDLAPLERLTTLQELWISRAPITDAALLHIHKLVELRELDLDDTLVTDAGLPALKSLIRLRRLSLRNARITDAGATHLVEMSSLKELFLSNTDITDAGVSHLSRLPELTWLYIGGTKVSDAGLAHLAKLTRLKHLNLVNLPQVTAKGMVDLQSLPNLESLSLDDRQFAEAGVESLRPLKKLNSLSIKTTQVSEADVEAIKGELPGVFVHLER